MLYFCSLDALSSVKMPLNKLIACKGKGLCIPLFSGERSLVTKILQFESMNRCSLSLSTRQMKSEDQFLCRFWGDCVEG